MKLKTEMAEGLWAIEGENGRLISISNSKGLRVKLHNFGPRMLELEFPDSKGKPTSLLLGYPDINGYMEDKAFQGYMAVGPYSNRIGAGQYIQPDDTHPKLKKGELVKLTKNDGENTLHGGLDDWGKNIWTVENSQKEASQASVTFALNVNSLKGPGEFPAPKSCELKFSLTEECELVFDYKITASATMPVNPTFHGYFNLNGIHSNTTVKNHVLQGNFKHFLPVDSDLIPTGDLKPVNGTRFDFTRPAQIAAHFGTQGYDDCFVFPKGTQGEVRVSSPETGIRLTMTTNQPAVQIYTGYFLSSPFTQYSAMCIESQQLVNAIQNLKWEKDFGPAFLTPGNVFRHKTVYKLDHGSA